MLSASLQLGLLSRLPLSQRLHHLEVLTEGLEDRGRHDLVLVLANEGDPLFMRGLETVLAR